MSDLLKTNKRFWLIILVTIICGLSAGVLGEIVTRVYILKDFSLPYFYSELNLSDLQEASSGLVIRDAKKVVVNQDVKVTETIASIRPGLVGVFKEIAVDSAATAKPEYYNLNKPLFIGLIMTADGWVLTIPSTELKANFKAKNYVAIAGDRRIYQIDEVAEPKNLPGDLLIFHLAGAANLPVKKIVPRTELTLGETLLAINNLNSVWPTTLTALEEPAILNSDLSNIRLSLAAADDGLKNSFVFDLAGDLAAIVAGDQEVIPAFSYKPFLQVFKEDQTARPALGVNYLNLSKVKTAAVSGDKGAWLYPTPTAPAVLKGSPAETAGLKAGDVITWVNNQEIDATNDLADVLSLYRPGDKVTLTYQRDGQERTAAVKLEETR